MVTVRFKIKNLWEFEELVYFVISERVKVEHNSLKMDDQHIRRLGDQGSFADINSFLASIAFVVINNFSFYKFL